MYHHQPWSDERQVLSFCMCSYKQMPQQILMKHYTEVGGTEYKRKRYGCGWIHKRYQLETAPIVCDQYILRNLNHRGISWMQLQALLERNQLLQVTRTLMKFWVKLHSPLKSETVNTVETFLCSPSPTEKRKKKHVCNFVKAHLPLVNDASCTSSLFLGRKNTKQDTVTQTG